MLEYGTRVRVVGFGPNGGNGIIVAKFPEDPRSGECYRVWFDNAPASELVYNDDDQSIIVDDDQTMSAFTFLELRTQGLNLDLKSEDLFSNALAEHYTVSLIEKQEISLGLFKLAHARNAGEYFRATKKSVRHGEFVIMIKNAGAGISIRTVQVYMQIASNWSLILESVKGSAFLQSQPLSINWALKVIRDSKSANTLFPLDLFTVETTVETQVETQVDEYDLDAVDDFQDELIYTPSEKFDSIESELNARAKSLGLKNRESGVLPDCTDSDLERNRSPYDSWDYFAPIETPGEDTPVEDTPVAIETSVEDTPVAIEIKENLNAIRDRLKKATKVSGPTLLKQVRAALHELDELIESI